MLLRLRLKNFLSFDDEMEFNMFPNQDIESQRSHIRVVNDAVPLLRQSAIFGENAAGKTNIVKALSFIKAFATEPKFIENIDIKDYIFCLKDSKNPSSLELAIEFCNDKDFFLYELEIGNRCVKKEKLSSTHPSSGELEPIFIRTKSSLDFPSAPAIDESILETINELIKKNPKSSLLSLNNDFPIIKNPLAKRALRWFSRDLEIIGINSALPDLIKLLYDNKSLLEFVKSLICDLELGLQNVEMHDEELSEWIKKHNSIARIMPAIPSDMESGTLTLSKENLPIVAMSIEKGERKVHELIFDQLGKDGYVGKMGLEQQSDGTKRSLLLLPGLYMASKTNKTIVVDELNLNLSPSMVKGLVGYFARCGETNGQLIFTLHDTQLLEDTEILRNDEIWFVSKKEGASLLYSLSDFKGLDGRSRLKAYNEGRFGAIHYLNLGQDKNDCND